MSRGRARRRHAVVLALALVCWAAAAHAEPTVGVPSVELRVGGEGGGGVRASTVLELVALVTVIGLAPSILILATSFTRILIALAILRQALGLQQVPPNQVLIGLALVLTSLVMRPVWEEARVSAVEPYLAEEIGAREGLTRALAPLSEFMLDQTRTSDLVLFLELAGGEVPETREEVPFLVLVPAFVTSELKTAFLIGFLLYIPFLVLDLVVGAILLAMGMLVLPPVVISLPLKLLLFVMVDGWVLVIGSLVEGFR